MRNMKSVSKLIPSMIFAFLVALLFSMNVSLAASSEELSYHSKANPVDERVRDLLSRMTLAEKIAQMEMNYGRTYIENKKFDSIIAAKNIGTDGIGSIHDFYPSTPELSNQVQRWVIEHNRLRIPALFIEETLHGYADSGSTTFPIPLGLAATWNLELVQRVGRVIATESRAHGCAMGLGPVLDIVREQRWGRVEETYGEDTELASMMGLAMVRGLQGDTLSDDNVIVAEPKHFAVHGYPVSGTNSSPVYVGKREALQFYLPVFETAIREGRARGIMSAYSEWNGVPCTGDSWLLTELLRNQWGFRGFVLGDMGAIRMLETCHFVTENPSASLRRAVSAGVDMSFYDFPTDSFRTKLKSLVASGALKESEIDTAVSRILRVKFELGLFDRPYVDPTLFKQRVHIPENVNQALHAARESIVLLKNNGILPLDPAHVKRIAVIGPNVNSTYTGGYSPRDAIAITLAEGIQKIALSETRIEVVEVGSIIERGVPIPSQFLRTPNLNQTGLQGSYYSNRDLTEPATNQRVDSLLDFDWGEGSPAKSIGNDFFTVRWEGWLCPTFDFTGWVGFGSDDGARLFLDDNLIIDSWQYGTNIAKSEVLLKAGKQYKIKLEYRENEWGASVSLRWSHQATDFGKAIAAAQRADVVILALGENDRVVGENRDRLTVELSGNQTELVKRIAETGKPIVLVLINGRPVALEQEAKLSSAIVEAWFGGEQAGQAIAEVLFGKVNPSGRLPITFPRNSGQLPCYYNDKPSKIMRYSDGSAQPLFPFGHGLSYTNFTYKNLKLTSNRLPVDGELQFTVDIANIGKRDGEEVVQVYLRDKYGSVTTPVKELKSFQKISLKSGEVKTVMFSIPVSELALWTADFQKIVEPGEFELMIGKSAGDIQLQSTFTVEPPTKSK
ncbi:MAG: glycoside hydrolase family 3 C-terminal domain-containing protein [bacterium]|nr:glycoside hydrolase family 3 C-terminal domain-containing protein [bacterium]